MDTNALRQKILDLAIRGKLVPQNPSDEPASVLLERIRNEKQQMLRDGKLKASDIKNDTIIFKGEDNLHYEKFQDGTVKCIENEIPFEVPEGWEWTRLSFLAQYRKGPFGSSLTKAMFIPESPTAIKVYEQKNAINKDVTLGTYYISAEKYESMKSFEIFPNDIIVSCAGTIGETFVIPPNMRKGIINQALMKISLYDLGIMNFYLTYFDFVLKDMANEQGYGNALKNIPPFDVLKNYLIPLPPLQEQLLIQEKLSQVLSRVDTIDNKVNIVDKSIEQAKSKILDLAIRGKLVPQDPNDEPASVLLERIRAEKEELIKQGKIKRDKNESVIYKGDDNSYYERFSDGSEKCIDNEVPFELPTGWEWERLENVATIARGGSPRPIKAFITTEADGINWIKIGDTEKNGKYIFSTREKIKPEGMTKSRYVKSGDFLLTNSMSFGRPYILKTNGCIHDGWLAIGNIESVFDQDFLYYALSSNFMYKILAVLAAGSTVDNLNSDLVKSVLFPIPPIKEQKTICKSVERCILIIDSIIATLC